MAYIDYSAAFAYKDLLTYQKMNQLGANDAIFYALTAGKPAFAAKSSSSQTNSTGDGTHIAVICGTEFFDHGSNYNASTGVFTAPVTGKYRFSLYIYVDNLAANHNSHRYYLITTARNYELNDTFASSSNPFVTNRNVKMDILADMSAGDTAQPVVGIYGGSKVVSIYGDGGAVVYTYFSGEQVA